MQLQTAYGEQVTVEEKDIFTFENGLPAFEDEKQFVILPFGEDNPFYTMQSVKTPRLSFVITEIFSFFKDYEIDIPKEVQSSLKILEPSDVVLFALLTVGADIATTTANLRAPIVANINGHVAKQIILTEINYSKKTSLLQQVKGE